jgi:hypothetical protein
MPWDDTKATEDGDGTVDSDEQLTADEWNQHVTDGHFSSDKLNLGTDANGNPVFTDPTNGDQVVLRYNPGAGQWEVVNVNLELNNNNVTNVGALGADNLTNNSPTHGGTTPPVEFQEMLADGFVVTTSDGVYDPSSTPSGYNDDILGAVQAANDDIPASSEGIVWLPGGTYSASGQSVTIDKRIKIVGIGTSSNGTVIQPTSSWSGPLLDNTVGGVLYENFKIEGQTNGGDGVRLTQSQSILRNIRINNVDGDGLIVKGGAYNCDIENVHVWDCGRNGMRVEEDGTGDSPNGITIRNGRANGCSVGIRLDNLKGVVLDGIEVANNDGEGVNIHEVNGIAFQSVYAHGNVQDDTTNTRQKAELVFAERNGATCNGILITGCWFNGSNNADFPIILGNNSSVDGCKITGNASNDNYANDSLVRAYSSSNTGVVIAGNATTLRNKTDSQESRTRASQGDAVGMPELPSDPPTPNTGSAAMGWLYISDGSADVTGDEGDLILQVQDSSGTTKNINLADFSAN